MHRHSMGALLALLAVVLVPRPGVAQDAAPAAREDKSAVEKTAEHPAGHRMRLPRSVPDAAIVARTLNRGSLVTLRDGSVWEIYLPDRPSTATWQSGDAVRVRLRPAPIGEFDYDLIYGPRRGRVAARFVGWEQGEEEAEKRDMR
ncbi:MAG: hypothetical protein ACREON_08250 [Gemmatimonadaceae bacterium]